MDDGRFDDAEEDLPQGINSLKIASKPKTEVSASEMYIYRRLIVNFMH